MTLTEDEIQEIYEVFGALMLASFEEYPEEFPYPLTIYDKDGNIFSMTIDMKKETLQ